MPTPPRTAATTQPSTRTSAKWGGIASFLMPVALVLSSLIYFSGDLRGRFGVIGYDLADFLAGPILAASLVTVAFVLRERLGDRAPRRMSLALLAAALAAGAFVAVALIRSSNRHYHLMHPELNLEVSSTVLVVWTTLVAGLSATAWHFLGWALLLIGSAGWTSRRLPRALSALYLVGGALSLLHYLQPADFTGIALIIVVAGFWQGVLLWRADRGAAQGPEVGAMQPA